MKSPTVEKLSRTLKTTSHSSEVLARLKGQYPKLPRSFLNHSNPFELLVATVLSAQCTDDRVNKVTPALFKAGPTPEAMVQLGLDKIRDLVKSVNFFNNKSKSIFELSKVLSKKYDSRVPQSLDELTSLPGVGRKTANVVLGNAFGIPAMVVDTHVLRTSFRLGFTKNKTPEKIEIDLSAVFPSSEWVDLSHRLILLGRGPCKAMSPKCKECFLVDLCPSAFKFKKNRAKK